MKGTMTHSTYFDLTVERTGKLSLMSKSSRSLVPIYVGISMGRVVGLTI
jgi:hypothetical protein